MSIELSPIRATIAIVVCRSIGRPLAELRGAACHSARSVSERFEIALFFEETRHFGRLLRRPAMASRRELDRAVSEKFS